MNFTIPWNRSSHRHIKKYIHQKQGYEGVGWVWNIMLLSTYAADDLCLKLRTTYPASCLHSAPCPSSQTRALIL